MILHNTYAETIAEKVIKERADAIRAAIPEYKKREFKEWRVFWPATVMYYINYFYGGNTFFCECSAAGANDDNIIALVRGLLAKYNLMEV